MTKVFVFSILFFLLVTPFISAAGFDIFLEEDEGKVTSFYDEYYIARVNGTLTIYNPSNTDFFNVIIPMYLSTYTLRSPNNTATDYIDNTGINLLKLPANTNVTFEYEVGGISTEDFTTNNRAMLETAISTYELKIYSSIMGSLLKAPFEDASITGRNNTRLISVHFTNPTGFDFNVDLVKVIKTNDIDPSNELATWDFSSEISSLAPYENIEFDFFDEDAYEGQIYWLQSDVYLDEIDLFVTANISSFDQDDLFVPITNATNITYNETATEFFDKRVFVRKLISSSLALPNQIINVTVIVNNFGTTTLDGLLSDTIPFGFELVKVYTDGALIVDNKLDWDIVVNPRTAQRFVYEVKFTDTDSVGVDYFDPATVSYGDNFVYSQSIPFVRQYVAEKKVYMQKSLDFLANGDVKVDIVVRNLGETSLDNLIVKEFLGPGDEFKEITKPFREKGVWQIETLSAGDVWETSYVTDRTNVLNSFPELFGIPRSGLFRNIILKNVVESRFKILETSGMEIFGLSLLALVIIAYIIPHSMLLSLKRNLIKDLKSTDKELQHLKESSSKKVNYHPVAPSQAPQQAQSTPQQQAAPPSTPIERSEYLAAREEKIHQTQAILDKIKNKMDNEK